MTRSLVSTVVALTLVLSAAPTARAQDKPAMVPLKLDLVISRTAGEKKVSSMPYTMWVTANAAGRNDSTSLRMGVQVPVPTTVIASPSEGAPASQPIRSYQYRDVGTNIDATAVSAPDGRYGIGITLSETGLHATKVEAAVDGAPMFRNFTSRFFLLLRDGQTATYTSATDPVTGETLNVQVTLSVLK